MIICVLLVGFMDSQVACMNTLPNLLWTSLPDCSNPMGTTVVQAVYNHWTGLTGLDFH